MTTVTDSVATEMGQCVFLRDNMRYQGRLNSGNSHYHSVQNIYYSHVLSKIQRLKYIEL